MELSARSYAITVSKTADVLNTPLPAGYLDELDQADSLAAAVSAINTTTASQLTNAAISALEEGRDPHADPDVARLLLDRVLASQGLEQTARARADPLLRSTLTEYADGILTRWADALEPHSAAMFAAAAEVPNLNLDDAAAAVARGGDAMHHAHAVQVANRAWTAAVQGFGALAAVSRVSRSGQPALIYTPARAAEFAVAVEAARTKRTEISAQILARHRVPLRLPTLAEYHDRAATFGQDRLAAQRDHDDRSLAAGFNR